MVFINVTVMSVTTGQSSTLRRAACEAVAILTAIGGKNSASSAPAVKRGQ